MAKLIQDTAEIRDLPAVGTILFGAHHVNNRPGELEFSTVTQSNLSHTVEEAQASVVDEDTEEPLPVEEVAVWMMVRVR